MKTDIVESFAEISAKLQAQQALVKKIDTIMKCQDMSLMSMAQLRIRSERLKAERRKLALVKEEMYALVETVILPEWTSEI